MSNMLSVISAPEDDDAPRPFPWRALLIALLLAALAIYAAWLTSLIQRRSRDYREVQRLGYLSLAGPLAEAIEPELEGGAGDDPRQLSPYLAPLFESDETLAYARLWSQDLTLLCEMTRVTLNRPRGGRDGALPELGIRTAAHEARRRVKGDAHRERIVHLREMLHEQCRLTDELSDRMLAGDASPAARGGFYSQQDLILTMAEALEETDLQLSGAVREMRIVLDALPREGSESLERAAHASGNAESALTLALERYRTSFSAIPALPEALRPAAPPGAAGWLRGRALRGQRLVVPLFVSVTDQEMVALAGFAEVTFYDQPAGISLFLDWRSLPAGGLLLALLAALLAGRRRRRVPEADDPADT